MKRKELATMGKTYYSRECEEYVRKSMEQIREGKVRNQKLKNNAPIHTGELEEQECSSFCDFLLTRNYFLVDSLRGKDYA